MWSCNNCLLICCWPLITFISFYKFVRGPLQIATIIQQPLVISVVAHGRVVTSSRQITEVKQLRARLVL